MSSNAEVARVDDGIVYAVSKGNATITAYVNGKAYSLKVGVSDANSVGKIEDAVMLAPMQTAGIKFKSGFKVKNAVWTSDLDMKVKQNAKGKIQYYYDDVVMITPAGKITAIGAGTTTLTAEVNGVQKSFTLTVEQPKARVMYISAGKSKSVKYYKVKNSGAAAAAWYVGEGGSKIAGVTQKGKVTGISEGRTSIFCEYKPYEAGGFIYETIVYVENPQLLTDAKLTAKDNKGSVYNLTLNMDENYVIQKKGVFQSILFSTSKSKIAFVDEAGVVSARGVGKAKLTARVNGKKITINVIVK